MYSRESVTTAPSDEEKEGAAKFVDSRKQMENGDSRLRKSAAVRVISDLTCLL